MNEGTNSDSWHDIVTDSDDTEFIIRRESRKRKLCKTSIQRKRSRRMAGIYGSSGGNDEMNGDGIAEETDDDINNGVNYETSGEINQGARHEMTGDINNEIDVDAIGLDVHERNTNEGENVRAINTEGMNHRTTADTDEEDMLDHETSSSDETDEDAMDEFAYTLEIHKVIGENLAKEGGWILKKGYSSDNNESIGLGNLARQRHQEDQVEEFGDFNDFYRNVRPETENQPRITEPTPVIGPQPPIPNSQTDYTSTEPNNYLDYTRTRFSEELPEPSEFLQNPVSNPENRNSEEQSSGIRLTPRKKRRDIVKIKQSTFISIVKQLTIKKFKNIEKRSQKRLYTRTELKRLKRVETLKRKLRKKDARIQFLEKMIQFNSKKANQFFGKPVLSEGDWV